MGTSHWLRTASTCHPNQNNKKKENNSGGPPYTEHSADKRARKHLLSRNKQNNEQTTNRLVGGPQKTYLIPYTVPPKHSWLADKVFGRAYITISLPNPALDISTAAKDGQTQETEGSGERSVQLLSEEEITGRVSNVKKISLSLVFDSFRRWKQHTARPAIARFKWVRPYACGHGL